jgi:VanZ family protein
MVALTRTPLRWFNCWLGVGWALVVLVVYLSISPSPIQPPGIQFSDKAGHLLAYVVLMGWFAQLYRSRILPVVLLLFMGVVLESIQAFIPQRNFEYLDMAANASGVLISWAAVRGSLAVILLRIEERWLPG